MPDHRQSKKTAAAHSRFESLIREAAHARVSHLPPLRELARQCGVSPNTMRGIVTVFKHRGAISIRERKGIFLNSPDQPLAFFPDPATTPPIAPPGTLRRHLNKVISGDIMTGRFPPDHPIPSFKELSATYGASYPTIRHSLDDLESLGILTRRGRGFIPNHAHPTAGRNRIDVIAWSDTKARIATDTLNSPELWRVLEQECQHDGITLRLTSAEAALAQLRSPVAADAVTLGYIILLLGLGQETLDDLLHHLQPAEIPVVILDQTGELSVAPSVLKNRLIRYFTLSVSPAAGEAVGKHLLARNHRKIAFFCPVRRVPCNENRFAGISRVYAQAGLDDAVVFYSLPGITTYDDVYDVIRKSAPYLELIRHRAEHNRALGPAYTVMEQAFYVDQALHYLSTQYWYGAFLPLFEHALADRAITAWVGVTDVIALLGLEYLRSNNRIVPQEICVVGIDDTVEALAHDLTSYNFNVPALVRVMLDHLYRPSGRGSGANGDQVEMAGRVMVRGT